MISLIFIFIFSIPGDPIPETYFSKSLWSFDQPCPTFYAWCRRESKTAHSQLTDVVNEVVHEYLIDNGLTQEELRELRYAMPMDEYDAFVGQWAASANKRLIEIQQDFPEILKNKLGPEAYSKQLRKWMNEALSSYGSRTLEVDLFRERFQVPFSSNDVNSLNNRIQSEFLEERLEKLNELQGELADELLHRDFVEGAFREIFKTPD